MDVQGDGAEQVALAAKLWRPLVHMSAIGADANSPSRYARTKAEGETLVLAAKPDAIIMRPSIIFGPEDTFFNRFGSMARASPALPLIGGGANALPAGICRRCRAGHRPRGEWQAKPARPTSWAGPRS